ncbi:MAG: hypothetical protein IKQ36_00290 [Clostridia bacterium]|nr:hypothetical protein [Clostridia bacterium]
MRELSEYTAEVMRRADEKKRARKRRLTAAVSVCAPLVLVLAFALPLALRGVSRDTAPKEAEFDPNGYDAVFTQMPANVVEAVDETALSPVRFEVTSGGNKRVCEDPERARELMELIDGFVPDPGRAQSADAEKKSIALFFADGRQARFSLVGGVLFEDPGSQSFTLGEEELSELERLLDFE